MYRATQTVRFKFTCVERHRQFPIMTMIWYVCVCVILTLRWITELVCSQALVTACALCLKLMWENVCVCWCKWFHNAKSNKWVNKQICILSWVYHQYRWSNRNKIDVDNHELAVNGDYRPHSRKILKPKSKTGNNASRNLLTQIACNYVGRYATFSLMIQYWIIRPTTSLSYYQYPRPPHPN